MASPTSRSPPRPARITLRVRASSPSRLMPGFEMVHRIVPRPRAAAGTSRLTRPSGRRKPSCGIRVAIDLIDLLVDGAVMATAEHSEIDSVVGPRRPVMDVMAWPKRPPSPGTAALVPARGAPDAGPAG